jgi:hypothetical protein
MDSNYVDDLIDDDEIPELTKADIERMKPFGELPAELQGSLLKVSRGEATVEPDESRAEVK